MEKLARLYEKYDIYNLPDGVVGDKLGDVYEDYVVEMFQDPTYIGRGESETFNQVEDEIVKIILGKEGIPLNQISRIEGTTDIPARSSGGNAKTDVLLKVYLVSGQMIQIPMSVKQTTAPKVAFAEYDVQTIAREVGITDARLIFLMEKHQRDASAKNFTTSEKQELRQLLRPYKRKFLRWIVTMSTMEDRSDIRIPRYVIKFQLEKGTYRPSGRGVFDIDEYITFISTNKNGTESRGGFGTGLSWTYATGSKGYKIQFKG